MSNGQIVKVHDEYDIITARMLVREMARNRGLSVRDQACISLATSSLAQLLLGGEYEGKIVIEGLKDGGRGGVRVVCSKTDGEAGEFMPELFSETRRMVDDMTIERLPANEIKVSIVKWGQT